MTNAVSIAQQGSNNTTFRNRIINGAMTIDQRNAGASVTSNAGVYTLDRWGNFGTQTGKYTTQQNAGSVTPPIGFTNYLGVTSSSAYSVGTNDYFATVQCIEGYNIADLNWGSANAKTITLSYWVRSSLTGTFGGALCNGDYTRSYPFTYTISSANTWEQKSITIAGDTTGTWSTTNGKGLWVQFGLGVGSASSGTAGSWASAYYASATGATSVVGTNGATFYITGVQLEAGSAASPFENRLYGTELSLCQRYYWKKVGQYVSGNTMVGAGMFYNSTDPRCCLANPVVMRTTPAITFSGSGFGSERATTFAGTIGTPTSANLSPEASLLYSGGTGTTAGTAGQGTFWYITDNTSYIAVSAEL